MNFMEVPSTALSLYISLFFTLYCILFSLLLLPAWGAAWGRWWYEMEGGPGRLCRPCSSRGSCQARDAPCPASSSSV